MPPQPSSAIRDHGMRCRKAFRSTSSQVIVNATEAVNSRAAVMLKVSQDSSNRSVTGKWVAHTLIPTNKARLPVTS